MSELIGYLATRLGEATTWATIAALLTVAHIKVDPGIWQDVTLYGVMVAGALGVLIRERGTKADALIALDVLEQIIPASPPAAPPTSPGA